MFGIKRMGTSTLLAALVLVTISAIARAQETIYVEQNNPSEMHAFTFDGASFNEAEAPVIGGLGASTAAVTDHLFLLPAGPQGLELSVIDPFTRLELPRVHGTVTNEPAILVTPDQHFALALGTTINSNPMLSVVDIRPSSPTFLQEMTTLALLPVTGSGDSVLRNAAVAGIFGAAFSPDGAMLYVSVSGGDLSGDGAVIAVNVTNPLSPSIVGGVRVPNEPAGNLRYGTIGGSPYLFYLGGSPALVLIPVSGSSFGATVTLSSTNPDSGGARIMTDVSIEDGASPKAYIVSDSCTDGSCFMAYEELLTIDLSGHLTNNSSDSCSTHPCVSNRYLFNNGSAEPFNINLVSISLDGRFLYVLSETADAFFWCPSELLAFDMSALNSGSPTPLLSRIPVDSLSHCPPDINSNDFVALAVGLSVHNAVTQTASAVTITDANTEIGKVFTNDTTHTLSIAGSNLNRVVHAYLGKTPLTGLSYSGGTLTATIPMHIPTGNPVLLLTDNAGALTPFSGQFTVNDPPQYLPKAVVYATGGACDQYAQINTASGAEVVSTFPTVAQNPFFARVTKDGQYLLVAGFDEGRLAVHNLIENDVAQAKDPGHYGWNTPVETLYAAGDNLLIEHMVQNPAPGRNTVYINALGDSIYMFDPTFDPVHCPENIPPRLIDADDDPSTTDNEMQSSPGVSGIPLPPNGYRSIAVSPDGNYLYAGSGLPEIVRIDLFGSGQEIAGHPGTDVVTAANITEYPIAGLAGGRVDGLAVSSDGTKIFFSSIHDAAVRVYGRTVSDGSVDTSTYASLSPTSDPWLVGDSHYILAPPDGRFLYVTSRSEERLDIFDIHDLSHIVYATKITLPLGGFLMDYSPANPTNDYLFVAAGENDSVTAIYEGPTTAELTQHQILTVTGGPCNTFGVTVSPGAGTAAGSNVSVTPTQSSTLTFSTVNSPGNTAVTSSNSTSLTTPPDFEITGATPVFYDVSTTASFTGPVSVCFLYDDTGMTPDEESALKLLHESGGSFVDVTTSLNTVTNTICGNVTSFSQFVVAQAAVSVANQTPAIFLRRGPGALGMTILGSANFDPRQIDPKSLILLPQGIVSTLTPGGTVGSGPLLTKNRYPEVTVSFPRASLRIGGTGSASGTIYLQGRLLNGTAFATQAQLTIE